MAPRTQFPARKLGLAFLSAFADTGGCHTDSQFPASAGVLEARSLRAFWR
jgi:hypothetical protein